MRETEPPQEPRSRPWQRWAQSLRDSDRAGFDEAAEALAPAIRSWFVWNGVKDFRDAEELTDDVLVWAWDHRTTYDAGTANLLTWITKCACPFALKNYHGRQRRQIHEQIDPQILSELLQDETDEEAPPPPPHERILAFLATLDLLPQIQRQIIQKLLEVPEMSNGEIAQQLNLTNQQVKVYKYRAFKRVKEIMDGRTAEAPDGGQADASA